MHESVLTQILREVEEVWRQQRIPDDLRKTYRTAFAKMRSQDVAHFISSELPLLREGTSLIQRAFASIQQREASISRLKKIVSRLSIIQVEGLQHKLSESISHVRICSLEAAELLFALSEQIKPISRESGFFPTPIVFPWKGRDYLRKMAADLGFLQRSKISRFVNVGSCADPMLLLPGLKPPGFQEFVIYKGEVPPAPLFVENMLVVPVPYKDIDRLLYATNKITAEHSKVSIGSAPAPTPPVHSSSQSSRGGSGGGAIDSSKPILPLRLKVLIQRFQNAATDEDSLCVRTRAVSEFADGESSVMEEERGKGVETAVADGIVDALIFEAVFEHISELAFESTCRDELASLTAIAAADPAPILVTLPSLSEESPLTPYLSKLECYEEELGALLAVYYQQLPASVLNISEKATTLLANMRTATQPSWRWIMDRSRVCGLIGFHLSGSDAVFSHFSTLREDWFGLVLPSVCQSFPQHRIFIPLQTWNGDELDTEKFAAPMRSYGFVGVERTVGGMWSGYNAVYSLGVDRENHALSGVEIRAYNKSPSPTHELILISPVISAFEIYSKGDGDELKFSLGLPAYELRSVSAHRYVRLKSSPSASISVQAFQGGYHSVCLPDISKDFLILFLYGRDIGPERKSVNFLYEVIGENPYPEGGNTPEAWVPAFEVSEESEGNIDFLNKVEDASLLPLRQQRPIEVTFPFLFAVIQTTIWKVSKTPLCTAYVTGPKTCS